MSPEEIITNIDKIYDQFKVPPHLQNHMRWAASVGKQVAQHWQGKAIDAKFIEAILLVHDMGNIAKIQFNAPSTPKLFGEEWKNKEHWQQVQKDVLKEYQTKDDHELTTKMIRELTADERFFFVLDNKTFMNNRMVLESEDWELKICSYADQRIGPFGVLTLDERFDELKKRYKEMNHPRLNNPEFLKNIKRAFELEKQIFSQTSLSPNEIK